MPTPGLLALLLLSPAALAQNLGAPVPFVTDTGSSSRRLSRSAT